MPNTQQILTPSDWIQLAAVVVALAIGIVSIWQSWKAIKQTQIAMADMARPYINVYVDALAIKHQQRFYVIKNFGQSPAYITSLQFTGALDDRNSERQMQSLVGNMLAPGQKMTTRLDEHYKGIVNVKVSYQDPQGKTYQDTFKLDSMAFSDFAYSAQSSKEDGRIPNATRQSTMALLRDLR